MHSSTRCLREACFRRGRAQFSFCRKDHLLEIVCVGWFVREGARRFKVPVCEQLRTVVSHQLFSAACQTAGTRSASQTSAIATLTVTVAKRKPRSVRPNVRSAMNSMNTESPMASCPISTPTLKAARPGRTLGPSTARTSACRRALCAKIGYTVVAAEQPFRPTKVARNGQMDPL
jgi:hypothetical protein